MLATLDQSLNHIWMLEPLGDIRIYAREHGLKLSEDALNAAMVIMLYELNMTKSPDLPDEQLGQSTVPQAETTVVNLPTRKAY